MLVGAALGFLYAPCAGPILAAVISVAATSGASGDLIAVAIGYGVGSAIVLLAIAYGGRQRARPPPQHGPRLGPPAHARGGDDRHRTGDELRPRSPLPDRARERRARRSCANPTGALERSDAVEDRLAGLRGRSKFDTRRAPASTTVAAKGYPVLGEAPDFAGPGPWLNTPASRPLSLAGLRGRVILVDFWTYTCINCLRTLPHVRAWDARYARQGLTIVGVHTPEFPFEKDTDNVMRAISRNGLRYPVLQDNDYATWTAWGNQYWPAKYLVDSRGRVRYTHFGEGDYGATEKAIRALLRERGTRSLGGYTRVTGEVAAAGTSTPETYLGYERARGFVPGAAAQGVHSYPPSRRLPRSRFALAGVWRGSRDSATAVRDAALSARFVARKVYLVLSSQGGRPRTGRVLLDGRPIAAREAGADVRAGRLRVKSQRLYRLVSLPRVEDRTLRLELPPGVTGYAFTFG